MKKRQKTTQARHYTARLNPINPQEKRIMEVIEYWQNQGVNFKQLVVDRLSRVDLELTPELFAKDNSMHNLSLEDVLQQYSDYLLDELRTQGFTSPTRAQTDDSDDDSEGDNGAFSRNLMSGFLARKRKATGDDE